MVNNNNCGKYHWYDDIPEDIKIYRKADKYFTHRALHYEAKDKQKSFLVEVDFTSDYSHTIIYKYTDDENEREGKSKFDSFLNKQDGWNIVDDKHEAISPDILCKILTICEEVRQDIERQLCNN